LWTPQEREEIETHLEILAGDSFLPDPADWIEKEFHIPELKGPIQLAPYQKRCLREALSKGDDGLFKYSVIVWSDIKKSAKSTITAAVALWMAINKSWGEIMCVANDLKQADSRVAYYFRRAIELHPEMSKVAKVRNYRVTFENGTKFEAVPIDPSGEAGGNADMVIFSELWGSHSKAQQRMWTEMTLPPLKFGKSFRWIETYAGYSGESPTLESLYAKGKTEGRQLWDDLPVYVNDAARLFMLWNTEPRLSWQTPEYYASEAATLTPGEFNRVHRNQWGSSLNKFVPDAWWNACTEPSPGRDEYEMVVVALDAAVSGDCFGVVAVARDPRNTENLVVRYAKKWEPQGQKLDYGPIEEEIRRISEAFSVGQFCYDPYQLHSMCTRLAGDGVGWFDEFKQGQARLVADMQLFDLIRDRRISHNGDPDLTEHIQNANAKMEGEKLRLVKRSPNHKIDLAVCLSMACSRALFLNLA
jgi:phage terminase large subunit-like protein